MDLQRRSRCSILQTFNSVASGVKYLNEFLRTKIIAVYDLLSNSAGQFDYPTKLSILQEALLRNN